MKKREPTGISVSALCVLTVNKESSSHAVAMETASVMTCGADKLSLIFFSGAHTFFPFRLVLHLSSFSRSSVFSLSVCWRHEFSAL